MLDPNDIAGKLGNLNSLLPVVMYAQYAPAYMEQCHENKNKVAKQSKAGKGKRRDCWKWRNLLQIFFLFSILSHAKTVNA